MMARDHHPCLRLRDGRMVMAQEALEPDLNLRINAITGPEAT